MFLDFLAWLDKDTPSSLRNTLLKTKPNCLMKRSWVMQTLLMWYARLPVRHGLPIMVCTNEKTRSKALWLQSLSYKFFHWSRPHVGVWMAMLPSHNLVWFLNNGLLRLFGEKLGCPCFNLLLHWSCDQDFFYTLQNPWMRGQHWGHGYFQS